MNTLTENEFNAADAIIKHCPENGIIKIAEIMVATINEKHRLFDMDDINSAASFLEREKFIKIIKSEHERGLPMFELDVKGIKIKSKRENKPFSFYWRLELANEERDEHYKKLQVRDLEEKLNIMNAEQRDFWKAQKQKNIQTTLIAIISALFSLIVLLKTWGFFG